MQKVKDCIKNLRELEKEHTAMGMEIMKAAEGAIYPLDLLAISVLNRSVCLLVGFCDLMEKENFVAATPLLRLQLDNLLRFHAAWLVKDPHDFSTDILKGFQINKMKDREGNIMSDRYLVDKISGEYPIMKDIYKHTSGYIHLSDKHMFNSFGSKKDETGRFNTKVGSKDSFVPESSYIEMLRAFFDVTGVLFRYLKGWAVTKEAKFRK